MLRRIGLPIIATMIASQAAAEVNGPAPQTVTRTIEVDAPAGKVWAVVGAFHDASWIPGVETTKGIGGNTKGARRFVTFKSGESVEEVLESYDANEMRLGYRIANVDVNFFPVAQYRTILNVHENGRKSVIVWTGTFHRGDRGSSPFPKLNDQAAFEAVTGVFDKSLISLKSKFEEVK